MNGETVREGELLDWGERQFVTAPRRAVRLRPNCYDFVSISETTAQRRNSGLRCSHENDAHSKFNEPCRPRSKGPPTALAGSKPVKLDGCSLSGGRSLAARGRPEFFRRNLRLQKQQQVIAAARFR